MLCLMYSKLFPRIKPFEKREHAVLGRWLFIWYHICRSALKKKKQAEWWHQFKSPRYPTVSRDWIRKDCNCDHISQCTNWSIPLCLRVAAGKCQGSSFMIFPPPALPSFAVWLTSNSLWLTSYSNARVMRKPEEDINSQDSIFSIRLLQINLILYLSS